MDQKLNNITLNNIKRLSLCVFIKLREVKY